MTHISIFQYQEIFVLLLFERLSCYDDFIIIIIIMIFDRNAGPDAGPNGTTD